MAGVRQGPQPFYHGVHRQHDHHLVCTTTPESVDEVAGSRETGRGVAGDEARGGTKRQRERRRLGRKIVMLTVQN